MITPPVTTCAFLQGIHVSSCRNIQQRNQNVWPVSGIAYPRKAKYTIQCHSGLWKLCRLTNLWDYKNQTYHKMCLLHMFENIQSLHELHNSTPHSVYHASKFQDLWDPAEWIAISLWDHITSSWEITSPSQPSLGVIQALFSSHRTQGRETNGDYRNTSRIVQNSL